jgi:mRNA-degrading endonuclease toxin of MazEF toxin-antitoxin module
VAKLEQGRIVWTELPSSDGTTTKRRPAIVITPTSKISQDEPFQVIAATTKFTEPLPDDHVQLPWHRAGKSRTQLRQPTVAVCTWIFSITESQVEKMGGVVPPSAMIEIEAILKRRKSE